MEKKEARLCRNMLSLTRILLYCTRQSNDFCKYTLDSIQNDNYPLLGYSINNEQPWCTASVELNLMWNGATIARRKKAKNQLGENSQWRSLFFFSFLSFFLFRGNFLFLKLKGSTYLPPHILEEGAQPGLPGCFATTWSCNSKHVSDRLP